MGADILDDIEALAGKVAGRQMLVATTLRRAAAEIGRLRGEVNPWQHAVDQQRVIAHLGVAADGVSLEEATKQLGELIDWHIDVATDPRVNGGYALVKQQPAPAMPNGVEADWKCIISVLEHGVRDGIHGGYNASYIKQQIAVLRAADNRDAAGVYSDCCDTPAYCSSVRRCTRLDTPAAVPAGEAVACTCKSASWDKRWSCPVHPDTRTTPPAPVQAAPQEGEAYQPVRFGGIRRPSDEALAAAFWEHRQRENSLPADLCDSKLVKFGNDIVKRARELAPYLAAHPSACELGADALEDLVTHREAWRNALVFAKGRMTGTDDESYWQHEITAFDRTFAALQHRGDSRGGEGS